MEGKNDLNSKSAKPMLPQPVRKELTNEWQQIGLFSIDGLPLLVPVSGMRRTLSWRLQTQELLLLGSVSLHGLCPADVSRKPARYRSLSACQSNQALSHGYSGPHFAQHLGPRQLGARLAHLRRLAHLLIQQARALYRDEEFGLALQQTVYALDATTIDLCLSLFPWAYFRKRKGAVKLHTLLDLRGNIPTVIIITHGLIHEVNILDQLTFEPGAFYVMDRAYLDFPPASIAFVVRFLCHPRPQTLRLPAALFAASRSHHRGHLRSDCRARQSSAAPGLSRQVTPHSLLRQHHEQASGLSYQQPHAATTDHRATLSQSLAGRVVLQMDQTTSAHQEVLRHFRECAQD